MTENKQSGDIEKEDLEKELVKAQIEKVKAETDWYREQIKFVALQVKKLEVDR